MAAHILCGPALGCSGLCSAVRFRTPGPRPGYAAASAEGRVRSSVRLPFLTGGHLMPRSLDPVKVLCRPHRAPRQKGHLVSPLRGLTFHSTNICQRLGIGCSGRSQGGPRTPLEVKGRKTTQMAPVNQELCIHVSIFKPKPGCTYPSENELHQCHPHIQPKVTLNVPSK